jgi:chromate transporter
MKPDDVRNLPLPKRLVKLFLTTFYLSAFTFGGGYVIITLLIDKFVDELKWIKEDEMLDFISIAQAAPGILAINGAILVGYKVAGLLGIICATLGAITPPFILLTIISLCYDIFKSNFYVKAMFEGMRAGVCAVIISAVFDMMTNLAKSKDIVLAFILVGSFIANYIFDVNVIIIMAVVAGIGVITTFFRFRKKLVKKEAPTG